MCIARWPQYSTREAKNSEIRNATSHSGTYQSVMVAPLCLASIRFQAQPPRSGADHGRIARASVRWGYWKPTSGSVSNANVMAGARRCQAACAGFEQTGAAGWEKKRPSEDGLL